MKHVFSALLKNVNVVEVQIKFIFQSESVAAVGFSGFQVYFNSNCGCSICQVLLTLFM